MSSDNGRITLGQLVERTGLSKNEIRDVLGWPEQRMKRTAASRPMPHAAVEQLRRLGYAVDAGPPIEAQELGDVPLIDGAGQEGAGPPPFVDDARATPQAPPGGRLAFPVGDLDYGLLAEQIEGVYVMAAHAAGRSDPYLEQAIRDNANRAGTAWARWVQSEPRVQALVRRMMVVGTPMGEVISVHITIVAAYVITRSVERERIAAAAGASSQAHGGAGFDPAAHTVE